jgi:hypothetical protein
MHVCALKADGSEIDPWYLLEGYGRGGDEEAAITLDAFDVQGDGGRVSAADAGTDRSGEPTVSRLKRTYSTYACMAVR